jgi:hypothetical protein
LHDKDAVLLKGRKTVLPKDEMRAGTGINQVNKGKAIPLQAWTGPEGSRRLRLSDFKTTGT